VRRNGPETGTVWARRAWPFPAVRRLHLLGDPSGFDSAPIRANHWGLVTTGRESALIGFPQGREEPKFWLANDPTAGQVFLADTWQWKVRHEYSWVLTDYRGAAKRLTAP
jgi:hypothetical protein